LDIIYYSQEEINIIKISEKSGIKVEYLQETINSLLKIKIIKHTNNKSIEDLKFYINYDFVHENNKISINSLIMIDDKSSKNEIMKEFLHDRNTIILSNLYDSIKKNITFTKDIIMKDLENKIPFKINNEKIDLEIQNLLEIGYITQVTLDNHNHNQNVEKIYKYIV
jgi:hypothetical protein